MLEDSEDDAILIGRVLQKDNLAFVKERVDTREEFYHAIREFKPDIILSDHGLPGFNSMEALKISLHERAKTPFILVTGTVSDDYAISCIRQGADDYILKSNLSRLPAAIRSAIKKRKLEQLKRDARHALRKQNEELTKVNKELDNFVYSVSHNLRGPLASAIGLVNLATHEKNLSELNFLHSMLGSSLHKLDETLNEILEYAKNARTEVQLGEIDWQYILDHCFHKLNYLEQDEEIMKDFELALDEPFFSDGGRITTLLMIVLSNAFQYRNKIWPARVFISVTVSEQHAILRIQDNGVGIPAAVLPKVYEMFYRGTEDSKGAGLGLYIAKEIVTKLNGKISVTSIEGEGATVQIVIPNGLIGR